MTYENLVPDDEPKATNDGPTAEEKLAAEKAEREKLEAQMRQEKAVLDAKMDQLERTVGQRFATRPQTVAPQVQQAREELNLSDEEILANPKAAVAKVAEYVTSQRLAEQNARNAQIFGNLAETAYQSQMQVLTGKEFYQDLAPYIEEYFTNNPQERLQAGRPEALYNELVGANMDELQRRKVARDAETAAQNQQTQEADLTRQRAESPPLSTPSPRGPEPPQPSEVDLGDLSDEKKELIGVFNELGVNLSEKEWKEIEEGRVFPKKVAADWQANKGRK